jgi:hypothetical protein
MGRTSVTVVGGRAVLVLGIAVVCTGVGCRARSSPSSNHASPQAAPPASQQRNPAPASVTRAPPPTPPPATPDACRACGGEWAVHGLAVKPSCNCRTTDAGKKCRDGVDCQGMCIVNAKKPDVEVVQAGPPARGFFVGRCSQLVSVFGCNCVLERGASAAGPVPLDEPPPTICLD